MRHFDDEVDFTASTICFGLLRINNNKLYKLYCFSSKLNVSTLVRSLY